MPIFWAKKQINMVPVVDKIKTLFIFIYILYNPLSLSVAGTN